jgi:hypothetical protein
MNTKKAPEKKKIRVMQPTEIELPDPPVVKEGEIAMRMVSDSGIVVDVVGSDGAECVSKARVAAKERGFSFDQSNDIPGHVASWERVA